MCANGLDYEMMVRFIDLSVFQQEIGFGDFFGRLHGCIDLNRREFLKVAGLAVGGGLVAASSYLAINDEPREGSPAKVTEAYHKQLIEAVRRRPRSLSLPYSMWTLRRLADYMAEETGLRVSYETVRRELRKADIVLSRPQHTISSPDPEYKVKKRRLKTPETI